MKDLNPLALLLFLLLLLLLLPPPPSFSCEEEEGVKGGHVDVCAPRKDVHEWCERRTCVCGECGGEDVDGEVKVKRVDERMVVEMEGWNGSGGRDSSGMVMEDEGVDGGETRKVEDSEKMVRGNKENGGCGEVEDGIFLAVEENKEKCDKKNIENTLKDQPPPPPPPPTTTTTTRDPRQAFPSSSVKCHQSPGTTSDLQCHFSNLYYHPRDQEFAFIRDGDSLIDGVDDVSDLRKRIILTSVARHNAFMFHVSEVPRRALAAGATTAPRRVTVIGGTTLIFGRFKPDNLHHVIHDDLLPLFFTMRRICEGGPPCPPVTLLATDNHAPSPHHGLYLTLTPRVLLTSDLVTSDLGWLRMRSAVVGLDRGSVWYQYGFGQPQGPVETTLTGPQLREFAAFMKMRLGVGGIGATTLTSGVISVANASVKARTSPGVGSAVKLSIDSGTSTSASISDVTSSVDPKTSTRGDISVANPSPGVGGAVNSIDSGTSTSASINDVTSSVDPKTSSSDNISAANALVKARTSTGVGDAVGISDTTPPIDDVSTEADSNVPIDDLNVDTSSAINAVTDSSTNTESNTNIDAGTAQSDPAIGATIDDVTIGSRTRTESPPTDARTRSTIDTTKVSPSKVVLISRRMTRKILNENELVNAIVRELWGQEEEEEEEEERQEEQDKERQKKNEDDGREKRKREREGGDKDREKERENERKKERETEKKNKNKEEKQEKIDRSPPPHTQTHTRTHTHNLKIMSLEENGLAEIIWEISTADILIGLHGAALILGLFLPTNSLLIELWPFAVSPGAAPVYRAMCALEGSGITYMAWVNADAHHSYTHPEYPIQHGGLSGVASVERERILHEVARGVEITSVTCCDDLNWLFRIYQDTVVRTRAQGGRHMSGAPLRSVPFEDVLRKGLGMVHEAVFSSSEAQYVKNRVYEGVKELTKDVPSLESLRYQAAPISEAQAVQVEEVPSERLPQYQDVPTSEPHAQTVLDREASSTQSVPILEFPQYQVVPNSEAQTCQIEEAPSEQLPQYQDVPTSEPQAQTVLDREASSTQSVPILESLQYQVVPNSEAQTVQIMEAPSERSPQYQDVPTSEPHAQTVPILESPQYQVVPNSEAQTGQIKEAPSERSPQYQDVPTSEPHVQTVLDKDSSTQTVPISATHQEPVPNLERPQTVRPARVRDLTCSLHNLGHMGRRGAVMTLTWRDPWTSEALGCPGVTYEVVMEYTGGEEEEDDSSSSGSSSRSVVVVLVSEEKYIRVFRSAVEAASVWVTCICAGVEGVERHIRCGVE